MIIEKGAARSSRRNVGARPKTMCRQKLRNEVPEAGKPALSCNPPWFCVSVRILHVFRIFYSRSILGSFVARRITDGASPFLGKGQQPVLVRACCGLVSKRSGRGGLLPPTRPFDSNVDAVGAPSAERGGSAQACGKFAEIAPEKAGTAAEEQAAEQAQEASAQSLQRAYGQRSDCASRVLEHACGGDELERHGARRVCRSA